MKSDRFKIEKVPYKKDEPFPEFPWVVINGTVAIPHKTYLDARQTVKNLIAGRGSVPEPGQFVYRYPTDPKEIDAYNAQERLYNKKGRGDPEELV